MTLKDFKPFKGLMVATFTEVDKNGIATTKCID
jgi:hypothetical protein